MRQLELPLGQPAPLAPWRLEALAEAMAIDGPADAAGDECGDVACLAAMRRRRDTYFGWLRAVGLRPRLAG